MARRHRRKKGHRKVHHRRKRRFTAKARAAAMRNLRKAHAKRKRHKGRGKRKRHAGKRKKAHRRRHHGGGIPHSNKGHEIMQRLINRGRSPQQAARVAARIERMRAGKAKRFFEHQAVQAKSATALSNVFANIGTAAHLANLTK